MNEIINHWKLTHKEERSDLNSFMKFNTNNFDSFNTCATICGHYINVKHNSLKTIYRIFIDYGLDWKKIDKLKVYWMNICSNKLICQNIPLFPSMTNMPSRYLSLFLRSRITMQILIDTWTIQNLGTWTTDQKLQLAQPKKGLGFYTATGLQLVTHNKPTI
jgi:hypothetical protein